MEWKHAHSVLCFFSPTTFQGAQLFLYLYVFYFFLRPSQRGVSMKDSVYLFDIPVNNPLDISLK